MTNAESATPIFVTDQLIESWDVRAVQGNLTAAHRIREVCEPLVELIAVSAFEYGFDGDLHAAALNEGLAESNTAQLNAIKQAITSRLDELTGEEHSLEWYANEAGRATPSVPALSTDFDMAQQMEARVIHPMGAGHLRETIGYQQAQYETNRNYEPSELVLGLLERSSPFDVKVSTMLSAYLRAKTVIEVAEQQDSPPDISIPGLIRFIRQYRLDEQVLSDAALRRGSFKRPSFGGNSQ